MVADSIFDVDFNRLVFYHRKKGGWATLFTHPNSHPYDSGLIVTEENHAVTSWLTKEDERPKYYKKDVCPRQPGVYERHGIPELYVVVCYAYWCCGMLPH